MARFPVREADISMLAANIIAGLSENPTIYPTPPVLPSEMQAGLDAYKSARDRSVAARAAYEIAVAEKKHELDALKELMKRDLRYAENTVNGDDSKLNLLGWAGRSDPVREAPGQCLNLSAVEQGDDWLVLSWKQPADGGKVAAYRIQRRGAEAEQQWRDIATAVERRIHLSEQPRHIDLEYRVIAMNRTGEGEPSNTVAAVL